DCDVQATNIILHGLPPDVYSLVNHQEAAKVIWDRVKLLMKGTELSYQERECRLKFMVKDLARLVDEIWLQTDRSGEETMWNNLAPNKVNIFVWRVLKGRLPVLSELDKRGIDLNTLLCPCCDDNVETTDNSLLLSNMAWSVWVKFFEWWKGGNVDVFTIGELFKHNGFNSQSGKSKK
ncbi:RNA-directed DNA polymerase, eukaryota, reverse transcriptase zinc-binding domain protein, partial [Tanacetum coccineum]